VVAINLALVVATSIKIRLSEETVPIESLEEDGEEERWVEKRLKY
jgi:hypothetical protein